MFIISFWAPPGVTEERDFANATGVVEAEAQRMCEILLDIY